MPLIFARNRLNATDAMVALLVSTAVEDETEQEIEVLELVDIDDVDVEADKSTLSEVGGSIPDDDDSIATVPEVEEIASFETSALYNSSLDFLIARTFLALTTATFHFNRLGRTGSPTDTTVVYLISLSPFEVFKLAF
jgi:hypothetical protein